MRKQDFDITIFARRFSELLNSSEENTYTVADKLGLTPATISRYANGLMAPKLPTLYAIADIFDVNPIWLFGFDAPREKQSQNKRTSADNNEGFDRNTIKIAGRDGSFVERNLTDEQLEVLKKLVDQLPDADDL